MQLLDGAVAAVSQLAMTKMWGGPASLRPSLQTFAADAFPVEWMPTVELHRYTKRAAAMNRKHIHASHPIHTAIYKVDLPIDRKHLGRPWGR